MAKKARKAKARFNSKNARDKVGTRKKKVATKKRIGKKTSTITKASPTKKRRPTAKTPPKKSLKRTALLGLEHTFGLPVDDMATRPAREITEATAVESGETKFLAVAACVNDFFAKRKKTINPAEPLKDADTMSFFRFDTTTILPVLGIFRAQLHPRFTLTITPALANICGAANETVGKLKTDINGATT